MRVLTLWLTAALVSAGRGQDDFQWHGKIAAGQVIEIKGVNGAIHAVAASGAEVAVSAVKRGRRSDPSEVRIQVLEHGGSVTICALYPNPYSEHSNECGPGEAGRMDTRDNDVEVEFTVQVPPGVRFVGRTVNGAVEATALGAAVEAHSVNGAVRISTKGSAEATTVNGSITASLGRADWGSGVEFSTVNGGITLTLPADLAAEVRAETVNGSIETEFPMTISGRMTPRRMRGTIGAGGPELRLTTVNGSIRLLKES